eukprot:COSAG01_NODE_3290_length_6307_cov_2.975519_2_plen_60_part_00
MAKSGHAAPWSMTNRRQPVSNFSATCSYMFRTNRGKTGLCEERCALEYILHVRTHETSI